MGTLVPIPQTYPAVQGEQTLCPELENVPVEQGVVIPLLQNDPAGHAEHCVLAEAPAEEVKPSTQATGAVAPCKQ